MKAKQNKRNTKSFKKAKAKSAPTYYHNPLTGTFHSKNAGANNTLDPKLGKTITSYRNKVYRSISNAILGFNKELSELPHPEHQNVFIAELNFRTLFSEYKDGQIDNLSLTGFRLSNKNGDDIDKTKYLDLIQKHFKGVTDVDYRIPTSKDQRNWTVLESFAFQTQKGVLRENVYYPYYMSTFQMCSQGSLVSIEEADPSDVFLKLDPQKQPHVDLKYNLPTP